MTTMDEKVVQLCDNCNRDIPFDNFLTHSVHCARNIKPCPVCKEPIPVANLQSHHKKKHEMSKSAPVLKNQLFDTNKVPCKNCGERLPGTDMEDHLRDSCGHTIRTCRFCNVDLPRLDLPNHENFCGSQTDRCPDCHEFIMAKYRTLHLESNHTFIRLNDDTLPRRAQNEPIYPPIIKRQIKKTKPAASTAKTTNDVNRPGPSNINRNGHGVGFPQSQPLGKKNIQKNSQDSNSEGGFVKNMYKYMPWVKDIEHIVKDSRAAIDKQNAIFESYMEQRRFDQKNGAIRKEISNLRPMSEEQFQMRLSGLNIASPRETETNNSAKPDRIKHIKSSLRDLRKDLNEVTAPFNTNAQSTVNAPQSYVNAPYVMDSVPMEEGATALPPQPEFTYPTDGRVLLPCEFCNALINEQQLIEHTTGCRPDLARLVANDFVALPCEFCNKLYMEYDLIEHETGCRPDLAKLNPYDGHPLLPCEICVRKVPLYLFKEHQKTCGGQNQMPLKIQPLGQPD